MISQNVTIPVDGMQMPAYLARPVEESGPHPAVIVLQEVFGVNAEMRRVTDLVAAAGYVGLAINYYHRTDPDLDLPYDPASMDRVREVASQISRATLFADLRASIAWLNEQPFVKSGKIATWGFCMGGSVAFLSATLPEICGAACFYGGAITRPFMNGDPEALNEVQAVQAPLLLCFGAEDTGIPAESIERIRTTLEAADKHFRIQIYPGVGHAFFRHGTPRAVTQHDSFSDEALGHAVADSWDLVQSFFRWIFTHSLAGASGETHT